MAASAGACVQLDRSDGDQSTRMRNKGAHTPASTSFEKNKTQIATAAAPLKLNPVAPANDIRLTFLESNAWLWQVRLLLGRWKRGKEGHRQGGQQAGSDQLIGSIDSHHNTHRRRA